MTERTNTGRSRICFVATVPFVINVFLRPHIDVLKVDYDVVLVANGTSEDLPGLINGYVSFVPMPIERKISIKSDVFALVSLWRLFRRERFTAVHSIMPKAGFLSMLAARLAGVRWRVHTFTGQVWATEKGFHRFVLKSFDRVLAMNATHLLTDSYSQRQFLIENKVANAAVIEVLAEGSFAGVNLERFTFSANARQQVRLRHRISDEAITFLFLGRLNLAKGLTDLARAFAMAAAQDPLIHLLVVGPDEGGLETEFSALAQRFPERIHRAGFTDRPEDYISAADVFCLPSHREGFGSVLIEAAAAGVPAIASRIYGITDAVEDGVTGILHSVNSAPELADAMLLLASDGELRRRMGSAARARAMEKFSEARVTRAFADFYRRILRSS